MKNLILALTVAALPVLAHGQSKFNQNYKVCRVDGTYTTCSDNTPTIVNTKHAATRNDKTITELHRLDQHVYVEPKEEPAVATTTTVMSRKNPRFGASYDDPNAAYKGEESKINDGVQKNVSRNINYVNNNNNGTPLPPNDGGNSDKR